MLKLPERWSKEIESPFREQADFRFQLFLEKDPVENFTTLKNSGFDSHSILTSYNDLIGYPEDHILDHVGNNQWVLDGSFRAPISNDGSSSTYTDDTYSDKYLNYLRGSSLLTNSDSSYQVELSIKMYPEDEIPCINIYWDTVTGNYPRKVKVGYVTSSDGSEVEWVEVQNNSILTEVECSTWFFYSIIIIGSDWIRLGDYPVITETVIGKVIDNFANKDYQVIQATEEQSLSIINSELPVYDIQVVLCNIKNLMSPLDSESISQYFKNLCPMTFQYGLKYHSGYTRWLPNERRRLSEWSIPTETKEFSFRASSSLQHLTDVCVAETRGKKDIEDRVQSIVDDVKNITNLLRYGKGINIASSLSNYSGNNSNSPQPTNQAFQLLAQAACHTLQVDPSSDVIQFVPWSKKIERKVGRVVRGSLVTDSPAIYSDVPIKSIQAIVTKQKAKGDEELFYEEIFEAAEFSGQPLTITWDDARANIDVQITGYYYNGNEVPSSALSKITWWISNNCIRFYPNGFNPVSGDVIVSQIKVSLSGQSLKRTKSTIDYYAVQDSSNEVMTFENPYINNASSASSCADFIHEVISKGVTCKVNYTGYPELVVGDIIDIDTEYGTLLDVMITKHSITFNGGYTGVIEGRLV